MTNLSLPKTMLGRTGLEVTRLGYGTAHRTPVTDEEADTLLNVVVDSGINFFDTARDYRRSEFHIGRFLSHRYSEFSVATKCGCTDSDGTRNFSDHVWTRENLLDGLRVSLKRLKTDAIDVMQPHIPTVEECERGGVVEVLQEMRDEGKVRWLGMSSTLPHLPVFISWGVFDTFQIPYSALDRVHEDWITRAAEAGAGIIVRGGIGWGEPGVGQGPTDLWEKFEQAGLDELREEEESRSAFVLRFTLTHPHAHTIIVGTTNARHLQENIETVRRGPLPAEVYAEAKRRLDGVGESPAPVY